MQARIAGWSYFFFTANEIPGPRRSDGRFNPSHLFHPLHIDAARDVAPRAQ